MPGGMLVGTCRKWTTILITGQSIDELTARAAEAVQIYWREVRPPRSPGSEIREIEVELTA